MESSKKFVTLKLIEKNALDLIEPYVRGTS